jgi:hypothetical protein
MRNVKYGVRRLVVGLGFALGKIYYVLWAVFSSLGEGFSAGFVGPPKTSSFETLLKESAIRESADFFFANMRHAWIARTREDIWRSALERTPVGGLILEFGVYKGASLTWFARHSSQEVFGFDNFYHGLMEDWAGMPLPKGYFAQESLPRVPGNATLIVGAVQDELPGFLQTHPEPIRVAHFDMDTYKSTLDVLRLIYPRLVGGSVIIFDEFFGYPLWQEGEYKAWMEFVDESGVEFKYFSTTEMQVGIEITSAVPR